MYIGPTTPTYCHAWAVSGVATVRDLGRDDGRGRSTPGTVSVFRRERAGAIDLDCTVDDLDDVSAFGAVSILPGPSHNRLIASAEAMAFLLAAASSGLVINSM